MPKSTLYEHDYLTEIKERLNKKSAILNITKIAKETGVPRKVINTFCNGEIPTTSFDNIVKLYKFLDENHI